MPKPNHLVTALALAMLLGAALSPLKVFASHPTVDLFSADNFAVLAGSAVNDTNISDITGDVGLSPAAWPAAPALTCIEVVGTIFSVDASGPLPCRVTNAGLLTTAKNDLTTAYNDAAARPAATIGTELAGATLGDGTYVADSTTFEIAPGGILTLTGDADDVFIFQMGTTLTTFSGSSVVLIGGAQACNVFWQVGSSAILGTGTTFIGNIMADQSITDDGGSTVTGRLLARIAAVTLNNTTITRAVCAAAAATGTSAAIGNATAGSVQSSTNTPVPVPTATLAPTVPAVVGLPQTGGGPVRGGEFPWSQALVAGGLSAIALGLGIGAYRRRAHRPTR